MCPFFQGLLGLDVERPNLLRPQPILHVGSDKLRPVVAARVFRHPIAGDGHFVERDDIV